MKWRQTSNGRWISEDGRGQVAQWDCKGMPMYFAMWYRAEPGRGQWLRVTSKTGRETFRRSVPKAFEAVEEMLEAVDRDQVKEAA